MKTNTIINLYSIAGNTSAIITKSVAIKIPAIYIFPLLFSPCNAVPRPGKKNTFNKL